MTVDESDEPILPGNKLAKESLRPCPECGENVRAGMVRCWNCGGFMNAKIQEKYQEIQSRPTTAITTSTPFGEMSEGESSALPSAPATEDEDDFELTSVASRSGILAGSPTSMLSSAPEDAPAPIPMLEPEETTAPKQKKEAAPARPASPDEALLDIAMQDENESARRRKKRPTTGGVRTASGGFLIFCPYGCRVEVKEQHRGMSGRCPRCKAPFIVPVDPPDYSVAKSKGAAEKGAGAEQPMAYGRWLQAVHLHVVPPEKLVLKADSLVKLFSEVDLGFGAEGMVVVTLGKKSGGGLFGGGGDQKDPREAILQHLKEGKPAAELPAADKQFYTVDQVRELRVVQPVASRAQSMFAGVPIFGAGKIAVQMPIANDTEPPKYISMGITEFRKLVETLSELFGMVDFGRDCGIPLQDQFTEEKCTYGGSFKALKNLEFYKADPAVQVVTVGWKCVGCGLTMSEEGRAKADFGGKGAKGIAKAKCPKCQQKFGESKLEGLPPAPPPAVPAGA